MNGTVKWYNRMKGYGFIEVSDAEDVFVHRSALPEDTVLYEGDKVEFETEDSEKGPQATNVVKNS